MLSEKDILNGNKLIAEFMGGNLYNKHFSFPFSFGLREEWDEGGYIGTCPQSIWKETDLEYFNSWEWLMPVVYKFLSLEDFSDPDKSLELKKVKSAITGLGIATPIDTVWNHLVVSIIWYNSVK